MGPFGGYCNFVSLCKNVVFHYRSWRWGPWANIDWKNLINPDKMPCGWISNVWNCTWGLPMLCMPIFNTLWGNFIMPHEVEFTWEFRGYCKLSNINHFNYKTEISLGRLRHASIIISLQKRKMSFYICAIRLIHKASPRYIWSWIAVIGKCQNVDVTARWNIFCTYMTLHISSVNLAHTFWTWILLF